MSKASCARYYQKKTKKRFKKSFLKGIKALLKKKTESKNMGANDINISQKLKNKGYLGIEKDIRKCKKIKRLMFYSKRFFFNKQPPL